MYYTLIEEYLLANKSDQKSPMRPTKMTFSVFGFDYAKHDWTNVDNTTSSKNQDSLP